MTKIARSEQFERVPGEYPFEGYPMLSLDDVFKEHGPVHGWTELHKRSVCPPTPTAEAEIGIDIMRKLGQLADVEQPRQ